MADGITGENAYIKFGSTVLSTNYRSLRPKEEVGMVDASAGNQASRNYLKAKKDGTGDASFVLPAGTAGTVMWGAVAPGTSGTLEWGEEGTTTGKPKHTVVALVKSRDKDIPYDDLVIANVSFQFSGDVTDAAY